MIKKIWTNQFVRYILVGFLGTGLDFLFLYLLVEYGHLFYLCAALISIAIVLWVSFSLNKYWTFHNFELHYFRQLVKYAISHSIGLAINLAILVLLVELFGLWYLAAKVFATTLAVIWNFLVTKNWVFSTNKLFKIKLFS